MQSNMNRRTILAGAAAVPVAALPALPALAGEADPVFAAIENYNRAYAFHADCLDKSEVLELQVESMASEQADREAPECIPHRAAFDAAKWPGFDLDDSDPVMIAYRKLQSAYCDSKHNKIRCHLLWGELEDHPLSIEMYRLRNEGSHAQTKAGWALADTVPTTAAGALALINWYQEGEARGDDISCWKRDDLDGRLDHHGEPIDEQLPDALLNTLHSFIEGRA